MCGFTGIFTYDTEAGTSKFRDAVNKMSALTARRGPDGEGYWNDPEGHLSLGFRRLAILDLTEAGNQPMVSADGRSVIVTNGEIYNFPDLRRELTSLGISFRSRSDTEVLLEALNYWGIDVIDRLNGMFAFAWYDRSKRILTLARDHAGIKPLYYYVNRDGNGVAFGSQFNCLLHTPWNDPGDIRLDVLHLYLRLHHIPPPYTIYRHCHQLRPGTYVRITLDHDLREVTWWTLPRDVEPSLSYKLGIEELSASINNVVRRQRIADVPLGVFLSGGIDSPLVSAVAAQQAGSNLKAFTIGNPGWSQDEAEAASGYANQLAVNHRTLNVSGDSVLDSVKAVAEAQYEPFADFSVLPTLILSQFARKEVTVALSGDGGDELFFGYERPLSLLRNGSDFRFPRLLRLALYAAGKYGMIAKRSDVIVSKTPGHYYFEVNCRIKEKDIALFTNSMPELPDDFNLYRFSTYQGTRHLAGYSRWVEFYGQLQRGLKKVDMASMYHSLEVRVPLLDREVIEVSLKLDPSDCMKNGTRKAVLRDLLGKYVRPETIPTPKRGFAVPLGEWLRGPLREQVEGVLFDSPLLPDGLFDRAGLWRYWEDHLSGRRDNKWGLWTILSLEWWLKYQI